MPAGAYLVGAMPPVWAERAARLYEHSISLAGLLVIVLIAADSIVNNWAFNHFLGNGLFFTTPLVASDTLEGLSDQYTFLKGASLSSISNAGTRMANYTVTNLVTKSDRIYVISAGSFPLTPATNLCPIFQGEYAIDLSVATNVRLALVQDTITFYRGNAITHAFTDDETSNVGNTSMRSDALIERGYLAGRSAVDMRFTTKLLLDATATPQNFVMKYYRIFPRNFCSGCDPVAELGYGVCNVTYSYNATEKKVVIAKSSFVDGSVYNVGLMMTNSTFGVIALYVKLVGIFFGVGGYLASRRTVQWQEVDITKSDSFAARVLRTVAPKYFPHASHALRYDMFCYNSDIFVFSYAVSVLLDIQNCLIFMRNVNLYNNLSPQFLYSLQMFCCSMRLLWVNCAVLKICKILWNLLGTVSYNGQSAVMGSLNLSSVTSLYLSAVLLIYMPPFIEYNNNTSIALKNSVEKLDGLRVDVFDGFYIRVAGSIVLGMLVNLGLITALDHLWNFKHWKLLRKHSLARQAMYNSSSIVCDYLDGIEVEAEGKAGGALLLCRARRLSTLQWFFMSHLTCFGLPEKEMRNKRVAKTTLQNTAHSMQHDEVDAKGIGNDDLRDTSYLVVQDGDPNIHLLDPMLNDVTSLVYNIKILKNTSVTIK
ncbi:hypothetical protein SDRG_03692 [Saprolegnia diclina VS20]|uniref:Uncharacterized protein n=1 Tax=Saprolegnia diclina (strain VS20) TaxID=1156394 RepID=T0S7L6_SAPDV|nr:hypothetical protein SDRG_03692 [Saprolegnia diclina VS20]EQC38727.1 hypothetical protein SDRG_03692 [Saprolegnia diclina VS20]|eukprot:XP_008607551.1 hypothetical protein SDRG_03692 [Saprolegnia diclina VS20]